MGAGATGAGAGGGRSLAGLRAAGTGRQWTAGELGAAVDAWGASSGRQWAGGGDRARARKGLVFSMKYILAIDQST